MDESQRKYGISVVAHEVGISAERLRKGEERGFFPPARRDPRYYTSSDIERLRQSRRTGRHGRG